jgi:hypothetical protein
MHLWLSCSRWPRTLTSLAAAHVGAKGYGCMQHAFALPMGMPFCACDVYLTSGHAVEPCGVHALRPLTVPNAEMLCTATMLHNPFLPFTFRRAVVSALAPRLLERGYGSLLDRLLNQVGHSMAQHGTAQHGTAWHSMARHSMAQHGTAWHGTAWHGTAWHGTAWHGAASASQQSTVWQGMARHMLVAFVFGMSLVISTTCC